jgi:hypothetical protein
MTIVALAGSAALSGVLAAAWALIVQNDAGVASRFAAAVVAAQLASLAGYVALRSAAWQRWRELGPIGSRAWVIVPGAVLVWQFGLLRHHPGALHTVLPFGLVAGIAAIVAAWVGLGRMVDVREPTAGV